MDNPNCNTEHRKNQHLTAEERHEIEVRLKDGWTTYRIAQHLRRPYNTIKNEIQRGTVVLYNGRIKRYRAQEGERVYKEHRSRCRRPYRRLQTAPFIRYVEEQLTKGWSLDACFGRAQLENLFQREEMVCTKTLYNYVDIGLINVKNIDLPDKLRRNTKKARVRRNKKLFGDSISQRPESVESREEFGHWEIDSVIGSQDESEPAVLTLVERKLRYSVWMKIERHTAGSVQNALNQLFSYFVEKASEVFKTITSDNGSEFSLLSELKEKDIRVFLHIRTLRGKRGRTNAITDCCADSFPKGNRFQAIRQRIFSSSPTGQTVCRGKFSDTIRLKSCLKRSWIASLQPELAPRFGKPPVRGSAPPFGFPKRQYRSDSSRKLLQFAIAI